MLWALTVKGHHGFELNPKGVDPMPGPSEDHNMQVLQDQNILLQQFGGTNSPEKAEASRWGAVRPPYNT